MKKYIVINSNFKHLASSPNYHFNKNSHKFSSTENNLQSSNMEVNLH